MRQPETTRPSQRRLAIAILVAAFVVGLAGGRVVRGDWAFIEILAR